MRVALDVSAVPASPAGAGVYIVELVRALASGGAVDLALVAARGDRRRWDEIAPGVPVHPVVPVPRATRLAWEQVRASALARRLGADVWHGPHYTMPLRPGVPAVVTVHDLTFFDHPELHERAKVAFFRSMIRISAARARVLVCVSPSTAARLRALVSPAAPVVVIPHGVDHGRFRTDPPGGPDADRARLAAVGVEPPYLLFVGTLEPRKNVPGLVRAFDRIASEHPDLRLVLAGRPGWGASAVTAAVADARHGDRMVRLGYVEDGTIPALLRQAVATVYPSFQEGFGIPALEALACGTPLVTSSGTPMADVAGDAAVLVRPGDDAGLAGALARVVDDGPLRDRLRKAGPDVAAAYTWERTAARHAEAYRQAAGA